MNDHGNCLRIRSIGTYLPSHREWNFEKAERVGFDRAFLENKLGVVARSVMDHGETTSDLGMRAFRSLSERMDLPLSVPQLLAVVTQHPDLKVPHTAAIIHNRLGLSRRCMTFDISQGCAGYTHAVAIITGVMDTANLDHGVLITSDPYSDKIADDDRDVSLLFGDAATATYFSRSGSGYRLVDANFGTVPDSYQCLMFRDHLEMNGGAVFKHAVKEVPPGLREILLRNELGVADIELFLLHQASKYLVEYVARKMGIAMDKVPFEAREYGNTVSSSIPLMLQKHVEADKLERVVLSGFGVGFTWGNNLLQRVENRR